MCEQMADLRKKATDWDKDIFLINCLGHLQQTLVNVPFTQERVEDLEEKIGKHVESMTYEHVCRIPSSIADSSMVIYLTNLVLLLS